MVKVQNGWEKQSLEELEDQTSQRGSPISAPARTEGSRSTFDSPRALGRGRRPSAVSDNSDQVMLSPAQSTPSDVSRSVAATPSCTLHLYLVEESITDAYTAFWRSVPPKLQAPAFINPTPNRGLSNGPVLAPAAEIGSRRKRRSSASFAPPALLSSNQRKYYSDLGSTPRTPTTTTTTPQAGILRMPSQQAEKDAVDTLLFMSSPNNSGRVPHTSADTQVLPSPLRSEIPGPRRVMFENPPPLNDNYQPRPGSHGPQVSYPGTG